MGGERWPAGDREELYSDVVEPVQGVRTCRAEEQGAEPQKGWSRKSYQETWEVWFEVMQHLLVPNDVQ